MPTGEGKVVLRELWALKGSDGVNAVGVPLLFRWTGRLTLAGGNTILAHIEVGAFYGRTQFGIGPFGLTLSPHNWH